MTKLDFGAIDLNDLGSIFQNPMLEGSNNSIIEQQIKNLYYEGDSSDTATRKAIMGALQLYGSFVMLFIFLLNLLCNRD